MYTWLGDSSTEQPKRTDASSADNSDFVIVKIIRVIVKSGVSASELGSDLVNCFHLDSIFEFNPGNHLCQVAKAA